MILSLLCLLFPGSALRVTAQSGLTAQELYIAANSAYNARDYAKAAPLYEEFVSNYGTSLEAENAMRIVLPHLVFSYIRMLQYDQALARLPQALALSDLQNDYKEELTFWLGACQLQTESYDEAYATLVGFAEDFPKSNKRAEAGLLAATAKILQEKWPDAATIAESIKDELDTENRGRAVILQLYALVEANELDAALEVLRTEYPRLDQMVQLAAFQMMALQVGSALLEAERYREALAALQRIWDRDRLLRHQEDRLDFLRQRQAALARTNTPEAAYQLYQLNQLEAKIRREIETFTKIEHYDSALRFRLASAFLGMQRYREAALVLEEMLASLPPDPVVEQASETQIKAWFAIERWPRAVEAANAFEAKFPQSEKLPLILYMKGQAEQNDLQYEASIATLRDLLLRYPKADIAPRALFLVGFGQLLSEDFEGARETFARVQRDHAKDPIAETAMFWAGMTESLDSQFEAAREQLAAYLERYPSGLHAAEAEFRRAYCAQSLRDFPLAIEELRAYLARHPAGVQRDEALLLLGDALMAEGEIDEGIAALKQIQPDSTKFYEEGWFKIAKALRLLEDYPGLRAHLAQFRAESPRSPRVAEAVYWMGWAHRQEGDDERAREVSWEAIRELGPDPAIRSVEDLFVGLQKLYAADDTQRALYQQLLQDLQEQAAARNEPTLQMRALWAEGKAMERRDPTGARAKITEAAPFITVDNTNPLILFDVASAFQERGELLPARDLYLALVKWNPRAPQRADAHAQLGFIALALGEPAAALEAFDEFDRLTLGSSLFGQVMLARATLLIERDRMDDAQATLEKVLASETTPGRDKAAALYAIGELQMAQKNFSLAVPYYQRLYVLYGRWTDYVAKAYLRSGEAFEALQDRDAALATYQEMLGREELADAPELEAARSRIVQLGGTLTPPAEEAPPTPAKEPAAS